MANREFMPILDDLIKQSEKENSHYYTCVVLKSCKQIITESNLILNLILDGFNEKEVRVLIEMHLAKQSDI